MDVQQAHKLSSNGEVLLVDIRSEAEWLDTGIAPQAITITLHQQGGISKMAQELLKEVDGDKNYPIALICAGGVRSSRVQKYLETQGFTHVYNVTEGMKGGWFSDGWIDQGLPIRQYP